MLRRVPVLIALWIAAAGCTGSGTGPIPSTTGSGSESAPPGPSTPISPQAGSNPIVLDVVSDAESPDGAGPDATYLNGMRTAVGHLNDGGGVEGRPLQLSIHADHGDQREAAEQIRSLVAGGATAVLFVGPGAVLSTARPEIERAGVPLMLLGGDLYTSGGLFRQVFQTAIPWEWQAHVIARYLVVDREASRVTFAGAGPEADGAARALGSALAYWGGSLAATFVGQPDDTDGLAKVLGRPTSSRWIVVFGDASETAALVSAIQALGGKALPGIAGSAALLVGPTEGGTSPSSRMVACYTYTWSGWAEPIPRVGSFRTRFQAQTGRWPHGLEQEGYDAVRVLADALETTGGRGGPALTDGIESLRSRAYSSFPVDFGPDDHVFLPRDELGLFGSALPGEELEPWMVPGADLWRPLMRTFTYDGERDNIIDRDKRVFFPFWGKDQPSPEYWRSRYGIVTRPSDPAP